MRKVFPNVLVLLTAFSTALSQSPASRQALPVGNTNNSARQFSLPVNPHAPSRSVLSSLNGPSRQMSGESDSLRGLAGFADSSTVRLIIKFKTAPLSRQGSMRALMNVKQRTEFQSALNTIRGVHAQFRSDAEKIDALFAATGVTRVDFEYVAALNGLAITTKRRIGEELQKLPYVERVYLDGTVKALDDVSNVVIGAPTVWQQDNAHGEGIDIGIIDSGIDYLHPALGGAPFPNTKVVGGYNFISGIADPMDDFGHGTHVAGIVAGDSGATLRGVAFKARLWAIKVLDMWGTGTWSTVIAGIELALDPDHDPETPTPIQVINMSLGGVGTPDDPVCQAVNNAVAGGIVCCVAAGNSGPAAETIGSPGVARRALTVGASDNADNIASFSSRGSEGYSLGVNSGIKPDIVAPGVGILSALPGGSYGVRSGTSMATPHVAGAAALLRQLHPDWTPDQVKAVLMESAHDIGKDIWTQGCGRIALPAAAADSVVVEPPSVHFGIDDVSRTVWTTSTNLKFTNASTVTREFALGAVSVSLPSGSFSMTYTPPFVVLQPGQTASVSAQLSVDNRMLTYSELPESYFGMIVASSTSPAMTIKLPFTLLKFHFIRFVAEETPFFLSMVNSEGNFYNNYYFPWSLLNDTINFWPRDESLPVTVIGTFWDLQTKIVLPNIPLDGIPTVTLRKADSKNRVVVRRLDQSGSPVSDRPGISAWNEEYMPHNRPSLDIDWQSVFGFFSSLEYMPPYLDTLYLPDLDSSFALGLVSQVAHHGSLYVYPFGISGGLTSSTTLSNDPTKFRRVDYTYSTLNIPGESVGAVSIIYTGFNNLGFENNNLGGVGISSAPFELSAYYMPPAIPGIGFWCTHSDQETQTGFPENPGYWGAPMTFDSPDSLRFYTWAYPGGDSQFVSSAENPLRMKFGYGVPMWAGRAENQKFRGYIYIFSPVYTASDNLFFVNPMWHSKNPTILFKLFLGDAAIDSGSLNRWEFGRAAAAGSYAFEAYDSGYRIADSIGKATVRLEFDTRRADPNPPFLSSLILRSRQNFSEDTYRRDSTRIEFDVGDDIGIDSLEVFFQPLGDENWITGSLSRRGNHCSIDNLPDVPPGYLSMRLRVVDPSRNVLDYRMEPAFYNYSLPTKGTELGWPLDGDMTQPIVTLLRWKKTLSARGYHLQVAQDSGFSDIVLDVPNAAQTIARVGPLQRGTRYYWRVTALYDIGPGIFSDTRSFTTSNESTYAIIGMDRGPWSIVSVPLLRSDRSLENAFPTALSGAFGYSAEGYSADDSLEHGVGYFLRCSPYDTFYVAGIPTATDTIVMKPGWNLIGSIDSPVMVGNILSDPQGMVTSSFWGWHGGYYVADSLKPGEGYWVKSQGEGKLILTALAPMVREATTGSDHPGISRKIRIVATNELPPPPPGGEPGSADRSPHVPSEFSLEQNYPNPFNPVTRLKYVLPVECTLTLKIYNLLGQVVQTLSNDTEPAGYKQVTWNASSFASGIYFYRLEATSIANPNKTFTSVKKMLLMK